MTDESVGVIVERLDNLIKKQADDEKNAENWRIRFMERLDNRPCERHSGLLRFVDTQLKGLWAAVTLIVAAIIAEFFKR